MRLLALFFYHAPSSIVEFGRHRGLVVQHHGKGALDAVEDLARRAAAQREWEKDTFAVLPSFDPHQGVQFVKQIGEGGQGIVDLVEVLHPDFAVPITMVRKKIKPPVSVARRDRALQEADFLAHCLHENIVTLRYVHKTSDNVEIFLDAYDMSASKLLEQREQYPSCSALFVEGIRVVLVGIAKALVFMHR